MTVYLSEHICDSARKKLEAAATIVDNFDHPEEIDAIIVRTAPVTAEQIEANIGISKDFNNFELTRALSEKDMARALRIADHFARNPKENPLLVTLGTLFTHFQRIFIVNYQRWLCRRKGTPMPPDAELARMLKLSSAFFLKEYQQAASLYPNSRVFAIMGLIREYDLKSKGIDSGQATDGELLKELLLKIFVLR